MIPESQPNRMSPLRGRANGNSGAAAGNRFVAVYPPFSTWSGAGVSHVGEVLETSGAGRPLGLYVHIPFCERKCDYCYYLSYAGRSEEQMRSYSHRVVEEASFYARKPALADRPVSFVYFGGGTPSLLSPKTIRQLGAGLNRHLPLDRTPEFTFECAPKSVDAARVTAMREIGVTRVSMGVQSFDDEVLERNGRVHTVADILRARMILERERFEWLNLDLIAGLLGESEESWRDSVRRIVALGPNSVTVYQLEIPYNTRLHRDLVADRARGRVPSMRSSRERTLYAFDQLEAAGYTIVNGYAAVLDPSRYRFEYQHELWHGGDMLALGVASFSYLDGTHFQNASSMSEYEDLIDQGDLPVRRARRLGTDERFTRELILGLKTGRVDRRRLCRRFGDRAFAPVTDRLVELARAGWIELTEDEIRLTRSGLVDVDRLSKVLYSPEYMGVRYS